jgi:5-methylphenazine-1-carboxylate 1-monooxygenase
MSARHANAEIAIVGGGIGGLSLALSLHQRGLSCEVFETVPEVKEIGVGITLLPHAMRELTGLGLQAEVEAAGIENLESVFYNRFGQYVYREPRGRHAGYDLPEIGIHRGKLHRILYDAVLARIGPAKVHTNHRCVRVDQDESGATLHFTETSSGTPLAARRASVVIACDGVNSTVRKQFCPDEKVAFAGINTWRGVTRHRPIFSGKSYVRIGSIETGKMVIYPIINYQDGTQLVNWVAEIYREGDLMNDWNKSGQPSTFADVYKDWTFDWLDVPALINGSETILEYPMVDKDPIAQWTFGRVTLLGDAAHPMYPRGSNGSAQAIIDGRVLATEFAGAGGDLPAALQRYEAVRRPVTSKIVLTNRSTPPDFIIMKADELSGGKPFRHIDDLISQDELRKIAENYAQIAGFSREALKSA